MIVLASSSPRRQRLLDMLGIPHLVDPAQVEECRQPGESPKAMAVRLATEKARCVALRHSDNPVLAADTVVVVDDRVLGKPAGPAEAEEMLGHLAGRDHRVITAVALALPGAEVLHRCDVTRVWFRSLSPALIRAYVATGEPLDKAGSYGVQGYGAVLVERVEGDFFGVMGLPLRLVVELLEAAGQPYRFTR
ncbi:MAG: septum formation inhibitor Maf [Gemmatimonadales bacterium]|nr:septum formation inhibitor Maf [Gemmatimonadales bacterium]NIN09795.1 septum formation inhibitor Maf [Gemmatimonadales bacterium]NIN48777.1 septum formation inhibitor Maf [Gemmatimonadales bacterium]NIP06241.1 septum formation inhibitor Maf [Gemmatimonadales bacterium]NIR02662.1 septum formation inhibitor Maf [Gemmatimonadales bacterium]